ncbi:MAG: acetyl-CoA carboxylase biotin carboxyl carrier protein [Planctomycetota bacterium]|nr:acetyl-CoA carboxylase biotin carboxyl carrier protein [Planctomycetota bacterium]
MTNLGSGSGDIFDVKKVRRLVELMKEHDLGEIDLKQGDQRIRLRRGSEPVVTTGGGGSYSVPAAATPAASSGTTGAANKPTETADDADTQVIKCPTVGTFYVAANQESPPFVKVGDHIGPESIVGMIEAMKVFSEIPAEISGQVVAVLVENGASVEFGQPLFKVRVRR